MKTSSEHNLAHLIKTRPTKTSWEHNLAHQVYEKSIAKVYHCTDEAFHKGETHYLAHHCAIIKTRPMKTITILLIY